MATKKCNGRCKTGKPSKAERKAIADWKRKTKAARVLLGGINAGTLSLSSFFDEPEFSFVALLPAPPTPGTPEYMRCIYLWMAAYMVATQQDSHLAQIFALQETKDGYLDSYDACMSGPSA